MHLEYPQLDAFQLLEKINRKELEKVHYRDIVTKLLALMTATAGDKDPVTIEKMAQYHFNNKDGTELLMLAMEIKRKTPPNLKNQVDRILEEFIGL